METENTDITTLTPFPVRALEFVNIHLQIQGALYLFT